ncbi:MAG: hypothetical protein IKB65_08445 [Ruminiclostridium sp.]|nr:hypothetical protein [Ruminiclostridium sp.]
MTATTNKYHVRVTLFGIVTQRLTKQGVSVLDVLKGTCLYSERRLQMASPSATTTSFDSSE